MVTGSSGLKKSYLELSSCRQSTQMTGLCCCCTVLPVVRTACECEFDPDTERILGRGASSMAVDLSLI